MFCVFDRRMEEIQNIDVTKNPEPEVIIESTKQKQSEEVEHHCDEQQKQSQEEEDELRKLLLSDIGELPLSPPSATQLNFVSYFITGSHTHLLSNPCDSVNKPFFNVLQILLNRVMITTSTVTPTGMFKVSSF